MGYKDEISQTLTFEQSKPLIDYIKRHGILQFLLLYKKFKDLVQDQTYWGDELELHLLNIDPQSKLARLQLNNEYIFKLIRDDNSFVLQPEYGAWMLETVPAKPYAFDGDPFPLFENLKVRRQKINSACKEGDVLYAGTVFPLLQVGNYFIPKHRSNGRVLALPQYDEEEKLLCNSDKLNKPERNILLNPNPRFSTFCRNILQRRGEDLSILVPIYQDEKTLGAQKELGDPVPGFIHMDETIFGSGSTSLQFTFGTRDLEEARYLTDQMHVFSSIILPLSAATAVFKGRLADEDVRWSVLCQSTDCRTKEERDPNHPKYIPKPRWSSVSRYISDRPQCKEEYNDIYFPLDQEMMKFVEKQAKELDLQVDERMMKHLGFLFLRDPLAVFADQIHVDDHKNPIHFESIQSTNWNNVRFKPPPCCDSEIGWRVELRIAEAQLTAEECTSLGMFSSFIAAMVMKKEYNFYIPISKVDENITRGMKRDAILKGKFWFRKDISKESADEWIELTIDEILHGKVGVFVGLFNLIYDFCKEEYGIDIRAEWARKKENNGFKVNKVTENMRYFEILSKRARGDRPTIAKWIRNFVLNHPKYQKDSIVTPEIGSDLISAMCTISDGQKTYSDFE